MNTQKPKEKPRILVWADSPASATGFATVIRGVFTRLADKYDIDIIGINDTGGWKDPQKYPFKIFPARSSIETSGDYYGRHRLINAMTAREPELKPPWDIVFTLNDPFIIEQPVALGKGVATILKDFQDQYREKMPVEWYFKTVSYWPIDSSLKGNWIQNAINLMDYVVAYTKYGKKEIENADFVLNPPTKVGDRTKVIYHGVDFNDYKPITDPLEIKKFRESFFRGIIHENTFLIISVARNQMRKDLPRTFQIFKEFQKRRPDSFLYIHSQESDAWGSLQQYSQQFHLEFGKDWGVPKHFHANFGYSVETLNKIYNAADCILSNSLGEGWGFYNSEGFATKTIVVAPDNTVHPELLNYSGDISDMESLYKQGVRGVPIKCKSTLSEWATYGPVDLERIRPLVNVDDAVKKLIWVYDNPDKAHEIEERAYQWIQQFTWDAIAKEWDQLFQQVLQDLDNERQAARVKIAKQQSYQPLKK